MDKEIKTQIALGLFKLTSLTQENISQINSPQLLKDLKNIADDLIDDAQSLPGIARSAFRLQALSNVYEDIIDRLCEIKLAAHRRFRRKLNKLL